MSNFRFALYQTVCPYDSMTLPEKEFILFGMKLASFINLLIFFAIAEILSIITKKICKARKCSKPEHVYKDVDDDTTKSRQLLEESKCTGSASSLAAGTPSWISFTSRLKLTFIKFLKLYFPPVAVACFKLTHCININYER